MPKAIKNGIFSLSAIEASAASSVLLPGASSTLKFAYTIGEAAYLLSTGKTSLHGHIKAGRLRKTKCGRKTLLLTSDIADFLARLQDKGGVQ